MNETTALKGESSSNYLDNSSSGNNKSFLNYSGRVGMFIIVTIGAVFLLAFNNKEGFQNKAFRQFEEEPKKSDDWPRKGHKIQLNFSAYTVNDYDCMQIDTGDWPSERIHCELTDDGTTYDMVVEHFDDPYCERPNSRLPSITHTASGCFFFPSVNHSYNDKCHSNRTFTISAFFGPGCLTPMPVTAANLPDENVIG